MYSLTCSDSVSYILSIKISQTSNKHRPDNGYKCEISEISLTTGELHTVWVDAMNNSKVLKSGLSSFYKRCLKALDIFILYLVMQNCSDYSHNHKKQN